MTQDLVGCQGRGCEVVQPHACHPVLLSALLWQWPEKSLELLGQRWSRRLRHPRRAIKDTGVARIATFLRDMPWPRGRKSGQKSLSGEQRNGGGDTYQGHERRHQATALIATQGG